MKKKMLSLLLALTLCAGLAAPALAAETLESVTISISGLEGYKCTFSQTEVNELTFALENAPSQYYFLENEYETSYAFAVPEGCRVTPSVDLTGSEYFVDGGGIANGGPDRPLYFDNVSSYFWDDEYGYAMLGFSFSFVKNDHYVSVLFYYLSPEGELDLNAPGNENMKADYEYDGIIDGEDGLDHYGHNAAPSYGLMTIISAPDKFGYKLRPITELAVAGESSPAAPPSERALAAADRLHGLGLFNGVGDNADGTPNYDLGRAPNRMEAVTLLVRMLGKEAEARAGNWTIPFTDVAEWARPYVGYAYANGLTSGTSATTFSGEDIVSATQYLTFVLRALGYSSDSDFAWDAAWELTDTLAITGGEYGAGSAFTRGDAVIVSASALDAKLKNGDRTLLEVIEEAPAAPGSPDILYTFTYSGSAWDEEHYPAPIGYTGDLHTVTIDVLSKYEAVVTFNTPYAQDTSFWYDARFTQSWTERVTVNNGAMDVDVTRRNQVVFTIFSYMEGEEFAAYTFFNGELGWGEVNAVFSEQQRANDYVSCRIKLPEGGAVDFEMLKDYEFTGNTACNYG